jgi:adenine-specific DNA-methyltransferase
MDEKYSVFGSNSGLIIEADNLAALQALEKDYAGRVDIMPIDPPYNTKIDYINYQDAHFANGWQAFMRLRMEMAYKLLSATGVVFIHIDENELFSLTSLCKEVFGDDNVEILIWKKVNGQFDANRVEKPIATTRRAHEYIVLCYKDKSKTLFNKIKQPVFDGTIWTEREQYLESVMDGFGTTASAKDELQYLFESREIFSTPKPMRLIKEFIRAGGGREAIVLDFFAGSGTTGHAVMDLNKEDGGRRKFILITNNENNICYNVTIPRILKVISMNKYTDRCSIILSVEDDGSRLNPC